MGEEAPGLLGPGRGTSPSSSWNYLLRGGKSGVVGGGGCCLCLGVTAELNRSLKAGIQTGSGLSYSTRWHPRGLSGFVIKCAAGLFSACPVSSPWEGGCDGGGGRLGQPLLTAVWGEHLAFAPLQDCPFIVCMTYAFHTPDKLCFILDLMNGKGGVWEGVGGLQKGLCAPPLLQRGHAGGDAGWSQLCPRGSCGDCC